MELKQKRLLLLGSTSNISRIVKQAQEMGIYVIVTDNKHLRNAPAKQIANEYINISIADIDSLVSYIKKNNINGVLTGFSDSYLYYYHSICKATNLPCYGDEHQFKITTNKEIFKTICGQAGVPTIPGGSGSSYNEIVVIVNGIGYPVILKPADNSGSRGVIKCENYQDLFFSYNYALSFSKIGIVICEKYMSCDNIGSSYQLIDGKIILSSVSDRYIYNSKEDGSSITASLVYPSIYTKRYYEEVNYKFINMLVKNGFSNGMLSTQAFVDKDSFYFCEMCYRPSGGYHYIVINEENNINSLKLLIEFAITGEIQEYEEMKENPFFKKSYTMIHIIGKPEEIISKFFGLEKVKGIEGVIDYLQALFVGDKIGKDGTTSQILASIWCSAKERDMLINLTNIIVENLTIENSKGESLIIHTSYF